MIIFLYGPDSYRSKQKLDEIIGQYKAVRKSLLNLQYLDASQQDFFDFYDNFKLGAMFAEKKMMVVKNLFANKKFQEDFLAHFKVLQSFDDIVVVYESEAPDERLKIFKELAKHATCQEFEFFDSKKTKLWIQKECEAKKQKINGDAADALVSFVGSNLWQLSLELQKLIAFKDGQVIKKEDVELLVRPKIENDIFKTIDALAAKNRPQALSLLQKHMESGDNPLYLLSMIAYQLKNLLVVKELSSKGLMYASIVKKSGLHPFVVKKNYFACSQFSLEQLKSLYKKLFKFDSDIKRGAIDAETALDMFVSMV